MPKKIDLSNATPTGTPTAPGQSPRAIDEVIVRETDLSHLNYDDWLYELMGHYLTSEEVSRMTNYRPWESFETEWERRMFSQGTNSKDLKLYDPRSLPAPEPEVQDPIPWDKYVASRVLARIFSKFIPYVGIAATLAELYQYRMEVYNMLVNRAVESMESDIALALNEMYNREISGREVVEVINDATETAGFTPQIERALEEVVVTGVSTPASVGYQVDFNNIDQLARAFSALDSPNIPIVTPEFKPEADVADIPDIAPTAWRPVRDTALEWQWPSGSFDIQIVPQGSSGISLRLSTKVSTSTQSRIVDPTKVGTREALARRPNFEENTRRKDRKEKNASRVYRAVMSLVTKTYGTYTELKDLYEVLSWNVYIDGEPLAKIKDLEKALKKVLDGKASFHVDYEGLALDYAGMQFVDFIIGSIMSQYGKQASETGWTIPSHAKRQIERMLNLGGGT